MKEGFEIDDLKEVGETKEIEAAPVSANPCVTIFKYRDKWAVCPEAGQNFIFSTLGQALSEAKLFLTKEEE